MRIPLPLKGSFVLLGLLASAASAQNIVSNPGFETGDFTSWTLGGNSGFRSVDNGSAHSGNFGADFGPVGSDGTMSQTLTTTAGAFYTLSFWLQNEGGPTNDFTALWNGSPVFTESNVGAFGYMLLSFDVQALGGSTTLEFDDRQDPSFWQLDDISVTADANSVSVTPEPATMVLLASGLIGLAGAGRRRRNKR